MSICYRQKIIADVRCTGAHLMGGIGIYLLRFSIFFDVKTHKDQLQPFRLENVRCEISTGRAQSSQRFLGNAYPEQPVLIRTSREYPTSNQLQFDISLTPNQLAELESVRNGGDLHFKLHLTGEAYGTHDPHPTSDDIPVLINQTEWIRLLKQADFADIVLFEVPLPAQSEDSFLRIAVDHLLKARDLFLAGHYDEAVGKCRLAIESCATAQSDEQLQRSAVKAFCNNRINMDVSARLLLVRAAVKHYTQLAHHDSEAGVVSGFSRSDASLILGVTAGLLAHAQSKF